MSWIWMIALCITHGVAYYMGRGDGESAKLSDDVLAELEKYEIDKRFEHMRWLAERRDRHDA